jgi:MFS family permease
MAEQDGKSVETVAARPEHGPTSLWRHRDFLLLWGGQSVSEVGSAVTTIALPLLAVLTLDATTFEVGALTAASNAAFIVVALPAGVWIDRWRKRPVLIWGDAGRVLVLGSIPVASALGILGLPQLFVVAALAGVLTVFFDVAYQSYLPHLVEPDQLVDANGKLGASAAFGQVAGPSVGGAFIGVLGAAGAIAIDAASFAVSTVATIAIRTKEPRPAPPASGRRMRGEVREGLHFVLGHPILRMIVGCTATANLCNGAFFAVQTVFLVRVLHASPAVIGLVFSLASVGGLVGGILAGRIGRWVGTARVIWLSLVVAGPFQLLAALAFPDWGVLLMAIGGMASSAATVIYNTAQVSYRQAICPPGLLGRMNASIRFIVWGTLPIGALLGGVVGSSIGLRPTLIVAALGGWASALWVVCSPLFGMRDVPLG